MNHVIIWVVKFLLHRTTTLDRLSSASNAIRAIHLAPPWNYLIVGLLQSLPVFSVILYMFIERRPYGTNPIEAYISLSLIGVWSFAFAFLVEKYERKAILRFLKDYKKFIGIGHGYQTVRRKALEKISGKRGYFMIKFIVISSVIFGYVMADEITTGFAIIYYRDFLWWILFFGAGLYGYYTSIGVCLAFKTIQICRCIDLSAEKMSIYRFDRRYGLSFVGIFSLRTTLPLITGWLLAPIVYMSIMLDKDMPNYPAIFLIIAYFIFVLVTFFYPIFLIRAQIKMIKETQGRDVNRTLRELLDEFSQENFQKFLIYRAMREDIFHAQEWPLDIDTLTKFVFTNVTIPLIVGLLIVFWS